MNEEKLGGSGDLFETIDINEIGSLSDFNEAVDVSKMDSLDDIYNILDKIFEIQKSGAEPENAGEPDGKPEAESVDETAVACEACNDDDTADDLEAEYTNEPDGGLCYQDDIEETAQAEEVCEAEKKADIDEAFSIYNTDYTQETLEDEYSHEPDGGLYYQDDIEETAQAEEVYEAEKKADIDGAFSIYNMDYTQETLEDEYTHEPDGGLYYQDDIEETVQAEEVYEAEEEADINEADGGGIHLTQEEAEAFYQTKSFDIEKVKSGTEPIDFHRKKDFSALLRFLNIAVITGFVIIASLCLVTLERPTISNIENRTLATMPKFSVKGYFSGDYTDGISQFFNDTVPGRDALKGISSNIVNLFGFGNDNLGGQLYGNIVELEPSTREEDVNGDKDKTEEEAPMTLPTKKEETKTTQTLGNEIEEGVISNGILVLNNRGVMFYGGSYTVGRNYASYLNTYKLELGKNVKIYSMVIPTSAAYYLPDKYKNYSANQLDNINNINAYLKDVTPVDVYTVLGEHKDEDIYSRTDHHWQPLGAYYASQTFAQSAGVKFSDLSSYEKVVEEGYVGTLYGYTQNASLKNNPEQFIYYKPSNKYTTTYYNKKFQNPQVRSLFVKAYGSSLYCTFLGSDEVSAHVKTDAGTGRKLAIIKDSFGNALVPFLTGSFDEIFVIDMRNFEINAIKFLKEKGVTDVLFASCSFSATGTNAKCIEKIRTQP